jgi:hypothetical protein
MDIELNKTCEVCRQIKVLDDFDRVTDTIDLPLKPDMRDWLDNYRDRIFERFWQVFEENKLDKPPELVEVRETQYKQKSDNIYDWANLNALFQWLSREVKEADGPISTKTLKTVGYILETIRRQAQDSTKDKCKNCSSRVYVHYR